MNKSTPGPWCVVETKKPLPPHPMNGYITTKMRLASDQPVIAVLHLHSTCDRDNARMAAAAPTLLAALEECLGVLTEPGVMDVDEWRTWKKRAIREAHEAITCARGEAAS